MEVGETIISHSKIGTHQELCFYFLYRTEVGCETSATMATEGSAEINGSNLSMLFWTPRLGPGEVNHSFERNK